MPNKLVCFGEVLLDNYPDGKKLGGAPLNVAAHLSQLGDEVNLISRIGVDADGASILTEIIKYGISNDSIQQDSRLPTGLVHVNLDENGIPTYKIDMPSSWDNIACSSRDIENVSQADALVFGSLACRNGKSKSSLLKLAEHSNLNICDLNIRQDFYNKTLIKTLLELSHVLKINTEEAELIQEMFGLEKKEFHQALSNKFGISVIIETKGKDGAIVFSGGRVAKATGIKVDAIDTVGSGDAFLATFLHHFLNNVSLDKCLDRACRMGAFVATKSGAIPSHKDIPDHFGI